MVLALVLVCRCAVPVQLWCEALGIGSVQLEDTRHFHPLCHQLWNGRACPSRPAVGLDGVSPFATVSTGVESALHLQVDTGVGLAVPCLLGPWAEGAYRATISFRALQRPPKF